MIEVFNESMIMIVNYHLLTFTLFNLEIERHFTMGWSFLGLLSFIMIVNIIYVVHGSCLKINRKKYLRRRKTEMIKLRRSIQILDS
jgi:ABC-type protease/lipase transport system fused ATPase/permease subunit